MKNLTKKLVLSIMTVALTFIALGTTTFAWFTLGGTVTAGNFTTQVRAADGIEVSLDGTNWYTQVSATDTADILTDITSTDGLNFKENINGTATAITSENLAGKLHQFNLYFRFAGDGTTYKKIYLDKVTATATAVSWTPDISIAASESFTPVGGSATTDSDTTILTTGTPIKIEALNAMRISFASYTALSGETLADIAASGTAPATGAKVYEIGATIDGAANIGSPSASGLAAAYAAKKGYQIPTYEAVAPTTSAGTGFTVVDKEATGTTLTATLDGETQAYIYAKVQVNIWLEGWDPDCINALLGQTNRKIAFEFKAAA